MKARITVLLGAVAALAVLAAAPAPAAIMQLTGSVGSSLVGFSDVKVDMTGMDPPHDDSMSLGSDMVFRQAGRYLLPEDETRVQDLYLWAQMLDLDGTLDGDLISWVQNGVIRGTVDGDIAMFAQDLRITGEVTDDLRVFAQNLWIDGTVKGDILGFAANMTFSEGSTVEGNILAAGGVVQLNGDVLGDVKVGSGTVNLNGSIGGNADLRTDGGISFGPEANVGGDLRYSGPIEMPSAGDVTAGSVTYVRPAPDVKPDFKLPRGLGGIWWLARLLMAVVAGSVIVALTKDHARRTSETIRRKPLKSLGIGFIALICTPIVAIIGMILIIPFMLSVVLSLAYLIALYVSKFYVSLWIGNLILRRSGRMDVSPVPAMLLGLLIVYILTAIPVAGTLIGLVIIPSIGIGALLQRRETRLNGAFESPSSDSEGLPDTFPGGPRPPAAPEAPAAPGTEA